MSNRHTLTHDTRPSHGAISCYLTLLPWDKAIYRIRGQVQNADFGLHEEDSNFSFLEW